MATPAADISWISIGARFVSCYGVLAVMMMLNSRMPGIQQYPVLDLRVGFDAEYIHDSFEAYGENGRQMYLIAEVLDFVYMLLYSQWMRLFILKAIAGVGGEWPTLLLSPAARLPALTAWLDLAETGLVVAMLLDGGLIDKLALAASLCNQAKWLLAYVTLSALAAAGLLMLVPGTPGPEEAEKKEQ